MKKYEKPFIDEEEIVIEDICFESSFTKDFNTPDESDPFNMKMDE